MGIGLKTAFEDWIGFSKIIRSKTDRIFLRFSKDLDLIGFSVGLVFLRDRTGYFRKLETVLKINLRIQKYWLIYWYAMAVLPYFSLMVFT